MNPDIIDFYAEQGLMVKNVVDIGRRRGYQDFEVIAALEQIYDRVQAGEEIKPINYVRMAYMIASHSAAAKYGEKLKAYARAHKDLEDAREVIRGLEEQLRKRTFRAKFDNWMKWGKWE